MLKLKLQYSGHLMRRADSLEKTLMLGGIGGRRRRGRQRMRWLDGITDPLYGKESFAPLVPALPYHPKPIGDLLSSGHHRCLRRTTQTRCGLSSCRNLGREDVAYVECSNCQEPMPMVGGQCSIPLRGKSEMNRSRLPHLAFRAEAQLSRCFPDSGCESDPPDPRVPRSGKS